MKIKNKIKNINNKMKIQQKPPGVLPSKLPSLGVFDFKKNNYSES